MSASENPKDRAAREASRVPLDLLEPVADEAVARVLAFGADKYGVRNYVASPIQARVYVAAMRRHLAAWLSGEDVAEDSGLHHLAHVGANVHVVLAAMAAGSFVDDRPGVAGETTAAERPCPLFPPNDPDDPRAGCQFERRDGGYDACLAGCERIKRESEEANR